MRPSLGDQQYDVLLCKLLSTCDFIKEWQSANAARGARFGDQNIVRPIVLPSALPALQISLLQCNRSPEVPTQA